MKNKSQTGSLLVTMLFVLALTIVVGSVLSLSLNSYRLAVRNEVRAQARAVAESELEHLFYLFKRQLAAATLAQAVPTKLSDSGVVDNAGTPVNPRDAHLATHRAEGWTVMRSMSAGAPFEYLDKDGNLAFMSYVDVKVEVTSLPGSTGMGVTEVRCGRVFEVSSATIFQNCIFYQDDLEMAPGSYTEITGDIVSNGSIYMGSNGAGNLKIMRKIKVFGGFNTRGPGADGLYNMTAGVDGRLGTLDDAGDDVDPWVTYRKPGTVGGTLSPPLTVDGWAIGTTDLTAPTPSGLSLQLQQLTAPRNLIGGKNAAELANTGWFGATDAENAVYRSLIVPPPAVGGTNEYPTPPIGADPMEAQRLYNRAGMIITISPTGGIAVTNAAGATIPGDFSAAVRTKQPDLTDISLRDLRENRTITVTDIDLKILGTLVGTTGTAIGTGFNGLLYVNLQGADSAVRLKNAEITPRTGADGSQGFSIVTNGGLYVQGSYNTKNTDGTDISSGTPPRSMLLADAITVLSTDWDDANSFLTVAAPVNDAAKLAHRIASADVTINAGLLCGNTPASATDASGGVQNLVRFLEDWSQRTATFNGSLGQLFKSRHFNGVFKQPGRGIDPANPVYIAPKARSYNFDTGLTVGGGPPGSPKTTDISRGRFYYW